MLLFELFTDGYDWEEHEDSGGDSYTFEFATDKGVKYDVDFERINTPADPVPLWSVEFSNQTGPASQRFGKTGSGNSPQVFATVIDIVMDFAQSHGGVYTFSADDPNRASLYSRMASRFIKPPLATATLPGKQGNQLFFIGMPDELQKFKDRKEKEIAYSQEREAVLQQHAAAAAQPREDQQ